MNLPVRPLDTPLPTPATPLCPHFGSCGGCKTQDLPYAEQLATKAAELAEFFGELHPAPIPVVGSPDLWYYRNKAEFRIDRMQYEVAPPKDFVRETVLGFRRRGKWFHTYDVEECRILSPVAGDILAAVRAWYRATGVRYHDSRTGEGSLQHLVMRETKRGEERLLILITSPNPVDLSGFVEAVLAAAPVTGILHGINRGNPDLAVANPEDLTLLHGADCLHEELWIPDAVAMDPAALASAQGPAAPAVDPAMPVRRLRFRISPFGFFQVNARSTERLYGYLRHIVAQYRPPVLYDLYGGSGGIALSCADLTERIVSVEEFGPASDDGRHNCALNGVDHVEFITRRVEGWLGDMIRLGDWHPEGLAILDPPRAALHPKALRRIAELGPPVLVYVSCNPKLLARELPALIAAGYRLRELRAFDLFPHTPHVEAVVWLELDPEARAEWLAVKAAEAAELAAAEAAALAEAAEAAAAEGTP